MTELLSSGPDVRWPELLKIADGDDVASMLGRLLAHGQQLLAVTGLSLWLPGRADPLDAILDDVLTSADVPTSIGSQSGSDTRLVRVQSELTTVLASTVVAAGLDRVQAALGEGPAHDAATEATVVTCDVLTSSLRWPRFAEAATDVGVRCTASVPLLRVDGSPVGVLSAYAEDPVPESSMPILKALGAHASVILETVGIYLDARRDAARLQDSMVASSVIEQAKGVLIMRERITADLADVYLRKTSELTHREIRDIAIELVSRAAKGTLR